MTIHHPLGRFAALGSQVLGSFAIWWGFVVTPIYLIGFALMVPHLHEAGLAGMTLPVFLPGVGVILAGLAVVLGLHDSHALRLGLGGVALNALPLAVAILMGLL